MTDAIRKHPKPTPPAPRYFRAYVEVTPDVRIVTNGCYFVIQERGRWLRFWMRAYAANFATIEHAREAARQLLSDRRGYRVVEYVSDEAAGGRADRG